MSRTDELISEVIAYTKSLQDARGQILPETIEQQFGLPPGFLDGMVLALFEKAVNTPEGDDGKNLFQVIVKSIIFGIWVADTAKGRVSHEQD